VCCNPSWCKTTGKYLHQQPGQKARQASDGSLSEHLGATFGQRLAIAMQVCGVTQAALSKATGIHATQISNMVRGEREPNLENVAKLLRGMPGCDARWLVCGA
jgi:ribosome-binding protein aMBF1 (putative translation factor)